MKNDLPTAHPSGELDSTYSVTPHRPLTVDTFAGKVHIEWDPGAAVTPLGQLPFFIQFLKLGGFFEAFVDGCPLHYRSNNAPTKRNALGSFLLSILSGHNRYAHLASLLNDRVNADLLGLSKIVSTDSARRALKRIQECDGLHLET